MKVAVTDANIFIDLINLKLVAPFFELSITVHTTANVLAELHDHQSAIFLAYHSAKKLTIHHLEIKELEEMQTLAPSRRLSDADKTVIYIAHKEKAMLLSSDGPVRKFAKEKNIETHGLVWLFDELVTNNRITRKIACIKINELLETNRRYKEDQRMLEEFERRVKQWSDK